jgi:hypothetical protein
MKISRVGAHICLLVGVLVVAASRGGLATASQGKGLPFSCEVFSAGTSAAALSARFGAQNLTTAQVPWGGAEGDFREGSVLFDATPDARLEIHWRDTANKRDPAWVSVRGSNTRWRTPAGITLGTTLLTIEQLNGRPFRLIGFGSDVSGTVVNWSDGRLEAQSTTDCRVRVRVRPDWEGVTAIMSGHVNGLKSEREYSSGHPAMQALNPAVYELFLQYAPVPAHQVAEPAPDSEQSIVQPRAPAGR